MAGCLLAYTADPGHLPHALLRAGVDLLLRKWLQLGRLQRGTQTASWIPCKAFSAHPPTYLVKLATVTPSGLVARARMLTRLQPQLPARASTSSLRDSFLMLNLRGSLSICEEHSHLLGLMGPPEPRAEGQAL